MNYHHTIFTSPSSCTAASQQFQHLSHLVTAAVGCVIFNLVSVIYLRQRFDLLLLLCTGGLVMLSLHQGQRGCSWPLSLYHIAFVSVTCDNVPTFLQILASRLYLCDVTGRLQAFIFLLPVH